MIIVAVIIIIANIAITSGDWSMMIWLLLILSLTLSFVIIFTDHHNYYYHYYFMFHSSTRYGVSEKSKTKKRRRERWVELSDFQTTQCLFTLSFKQLNLCLRSNICLSLILILTWREGEPDHKSSNPSEMTRKKREKPVQQKSFHEFVTKWSLTSPTTLPTMRIIS